MRRCTSSCSTCCRSGGGVLCPDPDCSPPFFAEGCLLSLRAGSVSGGDHGEVSGGREEGR